MTRTVVVGGGLSGLTAAWALRRANAEVVLLEASARAGGVVRSEIRGGCLLELGPNTVRPSAELWSLVAELGLADQVLLADPRAPRYIDYAGVLHALPSGPAALVRSRLLSASGKVRLLSEPFRRSSGPPDESVRDFVRRRLGKEAADRLVEPFVAGIFAGSAARLEAASAFPRLVAWERTKGSIVLGAIASRRSAPSAPRPPRGLLSFREGLETLPRALGRSLGDAFRPGREARSLEPRPGGGWIVGAADGPVEADRVILAAPAAAAARLVAALSPGAARALEAIPHPPLAVLHLSWPESARLRPLDGFGHLVCPSPDRRILGAVWSSSLFPGRAPAGRILLTVFLGGARDPEVLSLTDAALASLAARDLAAQGLLRGDPELVLATRWERSIPQYEIGHAGRIAVLEDAEARFPGLRFAGNYRGGISVADVVASGLRAAARQ